MPPKRKAAQSADSSLDALEQATDTAKKYKSAMDEISNEYLCPITTELPLDPVTAEDGNLYERQAIEEYFAARRASGEQIKSPLTNMPMGDKLLPSKPTKNAIEKLVRSGAISGDKAERWLERLSEEEEVKAMKERAAGGDPDAMLCMARWSFLGEKGLTKDSVAFYGWVKMGADADDPSCMALWGLTLVDGTGTEKQEVQGVAVTFTAAAMGSKSAARLVAKWYEKGLHGLPTDRQQAKRWYSKVISNSVDDLCQDAVDKATARLRELEVDGVS